MDNQRYALPDLSSTTPTDFQLLEEHLRPNHQRYMSRYMSERMNRPRSLNDRLPDMDPWELPGMPPDNEAGRKSREKYFLTDCRDLLLAMHGLGSLTAPLGLWRSRSLGWGFGTRATRQVYHQDPYLQHTPAATNIQESPVTKRSMVQAAVHPCQHTLSPVRLYPRIPEATMQEGATLIIGSASPRYLHATLGG